MTPYYDHAGITIYHGDCRDVLPTLGKFDLLLTDPPYGVQGGRGGDSKKGKAKYHATGWEDTPDYIKRIVVPAFEESLTKAQRAIVTPGIRHMHLYPPFSDLGCLWAPAAPNHGPWGFCTFNPVLYYGRDPRAGIGSLPSGITVTESSKIKDHPCAKPFNAWKWLLSKGSVDPADVILDPFVGSGTTLRAAKDLNRQAIGIEIEERYCEIAAKRMEQEVLDFHV